jgi:hypothetical protein
MAKINKWRCRECEWIGDSPDIVRDPKLGSDMEWQVCPDCRSAECFDKLCDSCERTASSGTPVPGGYRWTCHWHHPDATPPEE